MMYPFMQLPDGTAIEHSQVIREKGKEKVVVYFERDTKESFASAKCELPAFFWVYIDGFTEQEIASMEALLRKNAKLLPLMGREKEV